MKSRASSRRAGFTLLEVMIAAGVLFLVVGLALGLFVDANRTVGESLSLASSSRQADTLQRRIAEELRSGGALDLNDGNFNSISYRRVAGYDFANHKTLFSTKLRLIRFVAEEPLNGADDDGDGRIDEGSVELLEDGVRLEVLGRDVSGFGARFWEASSASPSLGQTPGQLDVEVRVTFVIQTRLPGRGEIHAEPRDLRLSFRNSE